MSLGTHTDSFSMSHVGLVIVCACVVLIICVWCGCMCICLCSCLCGRVFALFINPTNPASQGLLCVLRIPEHSLRHLADVTHGFALGSR